MAFKSSGYLLERFEATSSHASARGVEEFACPSRRSVSPKMLEAFHQQESSQSGQSASEQFSHSARIIRVPIAAILGPVKTFVSPGAK